MQTALARLPRGAARELQFAIGDFTSTVTSIARRSATGPLQRRAAESLSDQRTATGGMITGGGLRRLPSGNGTYGDIFFGAEFGGGSRPRTRQFAPYRSKGYFFWPALWDIRNRDRLNRVLDKLDKYW